MVLIRIKMIAKFKFLMKKCRGLKNKLHNYQRSNFTFFSVVMNANKK